MAKEKQAPKTKTPLTPQEMGRRRWAGMSKAERSEFMSAASRKRWDAKKTAPKQKAIKPA